MASELSPPNSTSETLDKLNETTGTLIDAFDQIIALPYVDSFRIDSLGDLSISDVILDLKQKYQELQGNTLPFARNLYAYAGLQLQTIPTINVALDLDIYLNLNKVIIARHKIEASDVKRESEAFRKSFVATLDVFESTIKELGDRIEELERQIEDTEDKQEKERAVAITAGVFTFVFTTAAVFAMITTAGAVGAVGAASPLATSTTSVTAAQGSAASTGFFTTLGASIGAAGGTSGLVGVSTAASIGALGALAETIISSIEARNYARAVSALKSLKSSAETARDQLLEVVDLMAGIEDSLDDIVTVWTDIETSLGIIESDVDKWNNENFSEELVAPTVAEWEDVRAAVEKYTAVVSGERSLKSDEEPEVELTVDRMIPLASNLAASELESNLQAPDLEFNGKLSDLKELKTVLRLTSSLPEAGNSLISQVETAERHLNATEKGINESLDELAEFAKERLTWLKSFATANELQKLEWVNQLQSTAQNFEESIARAQDNEAKAFAFQTSVGLINNTLIRIIGEKNAEQSALKKRLRDIEKARKRRKWLWVIPVAGAVNEIVDAANDIRGKIRKIRREVQLLSRCTQQLRKLSSSVSSAVKDSTLIAQTYSSILNDTRASADDVVLFEAFGSEIPAELFVSVKQSWIELQEDIREFKL